MSTKDLETKVQKLRTLKARADKLENEIKAVEGEIKSEMISQCVNEINVGIFTICWKAITSRRFDNKAFQADHADLYSMYTKASTSMRFTVA